MINSVQMRCAMKTSLSSIILLTLFALCAHGGEVERFIRETLAEQRARSATESSKVGKIIDDAVKGQKMPELELPKKSVFTSKDKERDARYWNNYKGWSWFLYTFFFNIRILCNRSIFSNS